MDPLRLELKQLIIEALDLEDLTPSDIGDDTPLFGDDGLGLDSIDALELGVALRKRYQLQLEKGDNRVRDAFRSVNTLAEFVAAQTRSTQN